MKYLVVLAALGVLSGGVWLRVNNQSQDIRTDYAEGECSLFSNPCTWAGEGCGGGHGVCTDNPAKYEGDDEYL